MKFSTAVLSSSLLATAAVAAPLTAQRQARHERRLAGRKTNPPYKPGTSEIIHLSNNTSQEQYSGNWAGAVLIGNGYTAVSAQFTVPTPSAPSGGDDSTQYCASAWVGIDGDTCSSAILQTGVDFCIQGGTPSFTAWYEWYPDVAYNFDSLTISAGDVISVSVNAASTSSGTATIENISTGQTVNHDFNGGVQGDLCETNAEWIVEDFESGGGEVPFADFGTVTFSNAQATTGGSSVGPDGATIMDIKQGDTVLTSSSADSNSVTVTYQ
ncbi:hypothetical protein N7468_003606 [Penicillium chermesinum]|uniref:Aspergillopepsin-2 n=1 Tax=Penicillium chermesinum TaxID=63820 RepID=A0A9W9TRY8_9EURO|nr:uncharacterized protein N7468_003606 [Penicillium chermesinum]KAJ5238987.1 hypothetical protein N7468_003606 [Penicillium chermesinum]KAJ6164630.1 hypothetical protein N7470_003302 [Penicillium chermesinum]